MIKRFEELDLPADYDWEGYKKTMDEWKTPYRIFNAVISTASSTFTDATESKIEQYIRDLTQEVLEDINLMIKRHP